MTLRKGRLLASAARASRSGSPSSCATSAARRRVSSEALGLTKRQQEVIAPGAGARGGAGVEEIQCLAVIRGRLVVRQPAQRGVAGTGQVVHRPVNVCAAGGDRREVVGALGEVLVQATFVQHLDRLAQAPVVVESSRSE